VIRNGRSAAEQLALQKVLTRSREVRTRVYSLLLDGTPDDDLTDLFIDGQVNIHAHLPTTRSLSLTLADSKQTLPFDSDDPSRGALFFDRMLQVWYDVLLDDDLWAETPAFTGPVTFLRRSSGLAYVEAHGKERLAMGASWAPMTLHRWMKKTDAIIRLLSERAGETEFDFPDLAARLPKPISLGRQTKPWRVAQRIAAGMGMQLYYNGAGTCRLRHRPNRSVFTFTGEDHVRPPGVRVELSDDIRNAVYVLGGTPQGLKTQIEAPAVAPRDHPVSPWALGRNDIPSYRARFIHDDTIKTLAEAKTVAERALHDGLVEHLDIRFDTHPVGFFLDPMDLCHVATADVSATFRLRKQSFPLASGSPGGKPATVGYLNDVTTDRSARR
jgi:hypothetical protein